MQLCGFEAWIVLVSIYSKHFILDWIHVYIWKKQSYCFLGSSSESRPFLMVLLWLLLNACKILRNQLSETVLAFNSFVSDLCTFRNLIQLFFFFFATVSITKYNLNYFESLAEKERKRKILLPSTVQGVLANVSLILATTFYQLAIIL